MNKFTRHITYLLLLAVALPMVSCMKGALNHYDDEICDYTVQLRYDYNEENTATKNMIEYYVYTVDEYIFDEAGILFGHRRFTPDKCTGHMNSELDLPPGKYSVIAIGNKDERSTVSDVATGAAPQVGQTLRTDMRLSLDDAEVKTDDMRGASEKLYHGYRTFTVKDTEVSRVRVDMVHSHFLLKFRVTWRNGATPPKGPGYHSVLETVSSEYSLMPQYIYPAGSFKCEEHDCALHDLYPTNCNNVIHHIPLTCHEDNNRLTHRHDTKVNADNELWGEFTTYRNKLGNCPTLRIYGSGGTMVIPREIDLAGYFSWHHINLDQTLRQEYHIDIIIDGNTISMGPLNVADWDEGGNLN